MLRLQNFLNIFQGDILMSANVFSEVYYFYAVN